MGNLAPGMVHRAVLQFDMACVVDHPFSRVFPGFGQQYSLLDRRVFRCLLPGAITGTESHGDCPGVPVRFGIYGFPRFLHTCR